MSVHILECLLFSFLSYNSLIICWHFIISSEGREWKGNTCEISQAPTQSSRKAYIYCPFERTNSAHEDIATCHPVFGLVCNFADACALSAEDAGS